MLKIFHTGDVHLDSPFSGLSFKESDKKRKMLRQVFADMMRFAKEKVSEIGNEIAGGEIEAKPFKVYHNSCEYCNFHPLCRFDYATHNYRVYTKKKDIDVSVMLQDKAEEQGEV